MNANTRVEPLLPRFASVEKVIETAEAGRARLLLHPGRFAAAAKRFLDGFPGDALYAIKANPAPLVLDQVWAAGIRHFDTASLPEIEIVHEPLSRRALPLHGAGARGRRGQDRVRAVSA